MTRHAWDALAGPVAAIMGTIAMVLACLGIAGTGRAQAATLPATGTITVTYRHASGGDQGNAGQPLAGARFTLYRVATVSNGIPTPVGAFADTTRYPVPWRQSTSQEQVRELADTLADLVTANGTPAGATAVTDAAGQARFTGLQTGLYLLLADRLATPTLACGTSATLVSLPSAAAAAAGGDSTTDPIADPGAAHMDVTIEPKADCAPPTVQPGALQVRKVWQDGNAADRPRAIDVTLYRDGTAVDVVTLSASNQWTHTWTGLAAGHDWRAVERQVPAGYAMGSVHDVTGGTALVTITNSKPGSTGSVVPGSTTGGTGGGTGTAAAGTAPTLARPAQTGATTMLAMAVAAVAVILGTLMIIQARRSDE